MNDHLNRTNRQREQPRNFIFTQNNDRRIPWIKEVCNNLEQADIMEQETDDRDWFRKNVAEVRDLNAQKMKMKGGKDNIRRRKSLGKSKEEIILSAVKIELRNEARRGMERK